MEDTKFTTLIDNLKRAAVHSTLSQFDLRSEPLIKLMEKSFHEKNSEGKLFGRIVYEAMFPWKQSDMSMGELVSEKLLTRELVEKLDKSSSEEAIPRERYPYTHQVAAWRELKKPGQSLLVSSGTGSGKTECFLIPIFNDILKNFREGNHSADGVQALFIYPLNALIASQKDRMKAWSEALVEKNSVPVKFCLYNSQLSRDPKQKLPSHEVEILDRQSLRKSPPALLVTNPTMLEYMLVRKEDKPILEKSSGKLKWIVIDEAHTYIGSAAAELALLLRRAILAFNVRSEDVHFVATSATMGSDDEQNLRQFMARIAGVTEDKVSVVFGERVFPSQDDFGSEKSIPLDDLERTSDDQLYARVKSNPVAKALLTAFRKHKGVMTHDEIESELSKHVQGHERNVERWLDVVSNAVDRGTGVSFLPLRLHIFTRTFAGIWACSNPNCTHKQVELDDTWNLGRVYFENRTKCDCGGLVFQINSCSNCGQIALKAKLVGDNRLVSSSDEAGDDEDYGIEAESNEDGEDNDKATFEQKHENIDTSIYILNCRDTNFLNNSDIKIEKIAYKSALFGEEIGKIQDDGDISCNVLVVQDGTDELCPSCRNLLNTKRGRSLYKGLFSAMSALYADLAPVLLNFCCKADESANHPFEGRRFISFTDSRQGTARSSAILDQRGQKILVESFIYNQLSKKRNAQTSKQADIRKIVNNLPPEQLKVLPPEILNFLFSKSNDNSTQTVKWNDLVDELARYLNDDESVKSIKDEFGSIREIGREIARILLFREFFNRNVRSGSLETQGLVKVSYGKEANVKLTPPTCWKYNDDDWEKFLWICMDYVVRKEMHIKFPNDWERYGGIFYARSRPIFDTASERRDSQWPSLTKRNLRTKKGDNVPRKPKGILRYLAALLGLDWASEDDAEIINTIMEHAYQDLKKCRLLSQQPARGYLLDFEKVEFSLNEEFIYQCPVSRKAIDPSRVIDERSPEDYSREKKALLKFTLPEIYRREVHDINDYLKNEKINQLRHAGLWKPILDTVVAGVTYFHAVEHSAQQDMRLLERYEDEFKKRNINIMSCSTTMEMGVDIGGVNMVTMSNVPPHPANYMQRSGRAGRRNERKAVTFTISRNNPHDKYVFHETLWAFNHKVAPPRINLNSQQIVQRHVNALLLSIFFSEKLEKIEGTDDQLSLKVKDWIKASTGYGDKYVAWLRDTLQTKNYEQIKKRIERLTFGSTLEYAGIEYLCKKSCDSALEITKSIREQISAAESQINEIGRKNKSAIHAITLQIDLIKNEYLLRKLASELFLPNYSFPVGIISFSNITYDDKRDMLKDRDSFKQLPSRNAAFALREYAPGATVVINGDVYTSSGIIVNWLYDNNDGRQILKRILMCDKCGSIVVKQGDNSTECPYCSGNLIQKLIFLEPVGYTVDYSQRPHKDVTVKKFIPSYKPFIGVSGDWRYLENPACGYYRFTDKGSITHYDKGESGCGYSVCLKCGRAEEQSGSGILAKVFEKNHYRLRTEQNPEIGYCSAERYSNAIKKDIAFGYEYKTDILQIILLDPRTGEELVRGPNAENIYQTIALAILRKIASRLGVDEDELGCEIQRTSKPYIDENIQTEKLDSVYSIIIYDRNNAGYCLAVTDFLCEILRDSTILDCPAGCEDACGRCLLTYQARYLKNRLNRKKALEIFQPWQKSLKLQDEYMCFERSFYETDSLISAVLREAQRDSRSEIYFYLYGDPDDWDIECSNLLSVSKFIKSSLERNIVFMVENINIFHDMSAFTSRTLNDFTKFTEIDIQVGEFPPIKKGRLLASVCIPGHETISWATHLPEFAEINGQWAQVDRDVLVRGGTSRPVSSRVPIPWKSLHDTHIRVWDQLDLAITEFGSEFWNLLEKNYQELFDTASPIVEISYTDRYIATPISVGLLLQVLIALREREVKNSRWMNPNIYIRSCPLKDMTKPCFNWCYNWQYTVDRDKYLGEAGVKLFGSSFHLEICDKQDLDHARYITILRENGSRDEIWLDSGFGFWTAGKREDDSKYYYNFRRDREILEQLISPESEITAYSRNLVTRISFTRN